MTLAWERQQRILAAVRSQGTVRLADLVDRLGVSAVTIRRDVTALADRGLVRRVHGGVTLPYRQAGPPGTEPHPTPFGPAAARTLVGMVVPSVDYYWPPVVQGAQAAVTAAGVTEDQLFELVICAAVGHASRLYDAGLAALAEERSERAE